MPLTPHENNTSLLQRISVCSRTLQKLHKEGISKDHNGTIFTTTTDLTSPQNTGWSPIEHGNDDGSRGMDLALLEGLGRG